MLSSATSSDVDVEAPVASEPAHGQLVRRPHGWVGSFQAMASPCEVHLTGADRETAVRVVDAVACEVRRIERKYSRYLSGNVVDRINHSGGTAVVVDDETAGLLDFADRLHTLSDGRFDITSGVLREVWRFDGSDRLPSAKAVRRVARRVGWRKVRWQAPEITLEAGMEIDLGGIGKEYAADRAADIARRIWPRCLVNLGGDLVASGHGIDRGGWTVGVEGVSYVGGPATTIRLSRGALATSGDARRYVLKNGRRYGHILDPRTGWPVDGAPRSVTVAAPTCTLAGMLATLAMLQGPEAERYLDRENVDYWCQR